MLTKSFTVSCYNPHDHTLAEHHDYAEEIGQRGAFPEHRDRSSPDSADRSSRYTDGPELLKGWGGPALSRDKMSSFTGQPSIKGRNESIRMMLLCAIHFGITFTWYGSGYFVHLAGTPWGTGDYCSSDVAFPCQTKWCSEGR